MTDLFCVQCSAGLHAFCIDPTPSDEGTYASCCCWSTGSIVVESDTPVTATGVFKQGVQTESGRGKSGEDMKSLLSTGRKRAAKAKPFIEGMICEWAGLKYAGGGVKPIIGCNGNVLYEERGKYARHHGPDKSVLNNSELNLHLICPTCHNRWHTENDPAYGKRPENGEPFVPVDAEWTVHDSITQATPSEIFENEVAWATRITKRTKED